MLKGKYSFWLLLILLVGFAAGVTQLLSLRFSGGDVYPPYSSLRADPLGSKAFYESLDSMPGLAVDRYFHSTKTPDHGTNTTLFLLGTSLWALDMSNEKEAAELESFMKEGGRMVVTLYPEAAKNVFRPLGADDEEEDSKSDKKSSKSKDAKQTKSKSKENPPAKAAQKKYHKQQDEDDDMPGPKMVLLTERWGYGCNYTQLTNNQGGVYEALDARKTDTASSNLPEVVSWHSAVYFSGLSNEWHVVYEAAHRPVVIERKFGSGSLILASDSYFTSNEALRKERQAGLLAWLVGGNTHLLFDETHLGLSEEGGVATLIRKYHLTGVVAGFILLALLFVWKNSVSLVPAYEPGVSQDGAALVEGKDANSGFINLLRRGIATREILPLCWQEWSRSRGRNHPEMAARAKRIETVINAEKQKPDSEQNPVATYAEISRILIERK